MFLRRANLRLSVGVILGVLFSLAMTVPANAQGAFGDVELAPDQVQVAGVSVVSLLCPDGTQQLSMMGMTLPNSHGIAFASDGTLNVAAAMRELGPLPANLGAAPLHLEFFANRPVKAV